MPRDLEESASTWDLAAGRSMAVNMQSRWPTPVLADELLPLPPGEGPSDVDRRRLVWLARPLQHVYPRLPDGSLVLPPRLPDAAIESLLHLQDRWSDELWDVLDQRGLGCDPYTRQVAA